MLNILYEDLEEFFRHPSEEGFLRAITANTKRYQTLFLEASDSVFPEKNNTMTIEQEIESFDQIMNQQRISIQRQQDPNNQSSDRRNQIPAELLRRLYCYLII